MGGGGSQREGRREREGWGREGGDRGKDKVGGGGDSEREGWGNRERQREREEGRGKDGEERV